MSFNFEKYLLEQQPEYNGHGQTVVYSMSVKGGLKICKGLEEYTEGRNSFSLEVFTDGGWTIHCKDFWNKEGHPLGHTDKMILSNTK